MRPLTLLPFLLLVACGSKVEPAEAVDSSTIDATDATDAADTADAIDTGDPARCGAPDSCVVVPRSCCGSCGAATPADMIGLESSRASAYRTSVCSGTGCPACFQQQDPFLQGFCADGRCTAVDLHVDPMTACASDGDCQLRYAGCCEPCGAPLGGLLALNPTQIATYRGKLCPVAPACPKCLVRYPDAAKAVCDKATGHCVVTGIGSL